MKIAIYSRKSKFTGKGESIENQIEMCQVYIQNNFSQNTNSIIVFEDEGFSGKNFDRPQFKQMMAEEYKNPFDLIIVYRLDRISRNVGDFSSLIDELNSYKTSFVSIKEQFDTSTPMGRAMMNIAAVFAQLERETIAERIKDNMYMLAKLGRWLGGTTPLGFNSEKVINIDNETKRSFFKLVQNNEETEIVKIIFVKYLELRSMSKLATYLINHNIQTRKGCNFAVTTIRSILTNPVYCIADIDGYKFFCDNNCNVCCTVDDCTGEFGFVGYSKTQQSTQADRIQNDMTKWIIAVGKHQGIISGEDFVKVQCLLNENADSKIKFKQSHNPIALLSGLLVCECGSYMRPKYHRVNKDNIKPFSYMCELKEISKREKCNCSNLNGLYADRLICNILLNFEKEDNIFHQYLDKMKSDKGTCDLSDKIKEQETLKEKKQQEIKNLITILSHGVDSITLEYINQAIVTLNTDVKRIIGEIDTLKTIQIMNKDTTDKFKDIVSSLNFLKENFNLLSIETKRNYIRNCISKIEWNGKDLHIFIKD